MVEFRKSIWRSKLPQTVKKLQVYIIDYNNTSKVALEQVEEYDNIFEINGTLSFSNSFQWLNIQNLLLLNDCQSSCRQVTNYEQKMRNRIYFDGESALKNHVNNKNISRIQQRRIFSLPNIWLAAVVLKNLFGNYFLNIYIALKDFEPFALNYGQIEFLEMKDKTMRIQNCLEYSEMRNGDQNISIEDSQIVNNMIRSYEAKEHPYREFVQHLRQIEY